MSAADPGRVRAVVGHGQGHTEIVFGRRGRWKYALWLVLFLAAWAFGGLFATVLLSVGADGQWMLVLWLVLWSLGGLVVLGGLLWGLLGSEVLVSRPDGLELGRRLLFWRRAVVLPATEIEHLHWIEDDPSRLVRVNGRRIAQPAIEIVTARRTLRCATGIGRSEADAAIAALRQRLSLPAKRR